MLLARLAMRTAAHMILFVVSAISVMADTEIRNFHLPLPSSTRSIHQATQILDIPLPTSPQVLNISHTNPEIWIRTPVERYKSWTARVSWPASMPTKFEMEVLPDLESVDAVIVHLSGSLLSPRLPRQPFKPTPIGDSPIVNDEFSTTFALVIEPLILGVLPKTAVPALCWIFVFGLGSACTVPTIIRYLNPSGTDGEVKGSESQGRKAI